MVAGGDWSGTPDKPVGTAEIYSFCIAAFADLEALNTNCRISRLMLGMPLEEEFHGHQMSDEMIAAVLEMALALDVRFGILLINKAAVPLTGKIALPPPAKFAAQVALRLLSRLLPRVAIRDLWCDEDIKGKPAQRDFQTAVSRINREVGVADKIKTRLRDSRISHLIQIADVYAYAMTKQAQGSRLEPALENVLRKIRTAVQHLILGPVPWEEER